jgi:hypothetical protein
MDLTGKRQNEDRQKSGDVLPARSRRGYLSPSYGFARGLPDVDLHISSLSLTLPPP